LSVEEAAGTRQVRRRELASRSKRTRQTGCATVVGVAARVAWRGS
jgi:hypothetical protein